MGAMLTPEDMQAAHPLPVGWYWAHDDEGWNAHETRGTRVVWVDADGNVRVEVDASDLIAEAPQTVALAVILANMGRGSLESIETDRDDARRALCEQIEDYWDRPAADLARMLYPDANLYPDQDPPPPTPAKV